jgi:3-oxoacyl-[acyl-carrier-protein] synthase II
MKRRVVITGIGALTPVGLTARQTWDAMKQGVCGIAQITAYDTSQMAACLAAELKMDVSTELSASDQRKTDRFTQLAMIAAREALTDSGLSAENTDMTRVDTIVSSGIGGLSSTVREYERGIKRGFDKVSPFYIPMTIANMAAGRIAIEQGLKGDCSCLVTACASSAHAIGEALRHIRHDYADAAVCGGCEATIIPMAMGGFTSMQALHLGEDPDRASIPFDAERSGFVMGEGAGMLVLEEYEHAKARGARIYAEVAGFGATCDAYHITAPEPDGTGAVGAMMRALQDAELSAYEIGYINAHGTSTPLNDKSEAMAVHKVFGEDAELAVSSTKSMTGHLLGAAGAVEAMVCAMAIHDSFIPPTINYRVPDPECDLDVVPNEGRSAAVQSTLSNSFGFGGHNATLAIVRCG